MKKLSSFNDRIEAGTLKSRLESAGIACFLKNEHSSNVYGGLLPIATPEIWVLKDEELAKAQELLKQWRSVPPAAQPAWKCPKCGEIIEGQFGSCWKCGEPAPPMPPAQ